MYRYPSFVTPLAVLFPILYLPLVARENSDFWGSHLRFCHFASDSEELREDVQSRTWRCAEE